MQRPTVSSARRWRLALLVAVLSLGGTNVARADLTPDPLRVPASEQGQTLDRNVLAKAQPDECFYGSDKPIGQLSADGTCAPLPDGTTGQPKVNQAYVWGLTETKIGGDRSLWFGTAPNVHCLVASGYLGSTSVIQTSSYVCEPQRTAVIGGQTRTIGDFRPPDLFRYDDTTGQQTNLGKALATAAAGGDATARHAYELLQGTLGVRSAGNKDGVVLFGGPSIAARGTINMFAFDAATGNVLGAQNIPNYSNIRKWVNVGGQLYTGVANNTGYKPEGSETAQAPGGKVLRWTGSKTDPFAFEEVGDLDGEAAELAGFEGRLFVATWPCCEASGGTATQHVNAGVWMSPKLGSDGMLTSADYARTSWTKVWKVDDYEPDPVTAATYGGGALVAYDGKLYWGTMHVPGVALQAHSQLYPDLCSGAAAVKCFINTNRAINIFRASGFQDGKQDTPVQVLYGDPTESSYVTDNSPVKPTDYTDPGWYDVPTGGRAGTPSGGGTYGGAGFGNRFNNYTWTMDVFQGQLYVGTMDYSYLLKDAADEPDAGLAGLVWPLIQKKYDAQPGADLWRFPAGDRPAVAESTQGVGNYANYGIRTMIADDQTGALYLGMANPMNLMTDKTDAKPEGGWELLKLTPRGSGGGGTPPPVPQPFTLDRLGGHDRYATAAEIARATYHKGDTTEAVVVSGQGFADAVTASYLAGRLHAPVLLTKAGTLPEATSQALSDLGTKNVTLLGGNRAVSETVAASLHGLGYTVHRVSGHDRYATAAAAATEPGAGAVGSTADGRTAIVSSGEQFPDALTAGPLADAKAFPMLLTRASTLPGVTRSALATLGVKHVLLTGGPAAVSSGVEHELTSLGISVDRLAGANRAGTAVAIADYAVSHLGFPARHVDLAVGSVFADALAGGPHAGEALASIMLTASPTANAPETLTWLSGHASTLTSGHVLGGPAAVSDTVKAEAEAQVRGH